MQISPIQNAIPASIAQSLQHGNDGEASFDIRDMLPPDMVNYSVAGRSLLVMALEGDCQNSFAELILKGADVNTITPNTDTLLMLAAQISNPFYINLLVTEVNLNVFAKNQLGQTASDIALLHKNEDNYKILKNLENWILAPQKNAQVEKLRLDCTSYFFNKPQDILKFVVAPMVLDQRTGFAHTLSSKK